MLSPASVVSDVSHTSHTPWKTVTITPRVSLQKLATCEFRQYCPQGTIRVRFLPIARLAPRYPAQTILWVLTWSSLSYSFLCLLALYRCWWNRSNWWISYCRALPYACMERQISSDTIDVLEINVSIMWNWRVLMHNFVLETLSECRKRIAMGIHKTHTATHPRSPTVHTCPHLLWLLPNFEELAIHFTVTATLPCFQRPPGVGVSSTLLNFPLSTDYPPYSLFFFKIFIFFSFSLHFFLLHTERQARE